LQRVVSKTKIIYIYSIYVVLPLGTDITSILDVICYIRCTNCVLIACLWRQC